MPLPFAVPLIPLLKLLALGSIKFIVVFVGAFVAPILTLRLLVNGAAGVVRPVADWLAENGHIDEETRVAAKREAEIMNTVQYTRAEAREILLTLSRNTANQMKAAVIGIPGTVARFLSDIAKRLSR